MWHFLLSLLNRCFIAFVFISRLCPFHAKQSLVKVKPPSHKRKAVKGPKALLRSLEHYCKNPRHDPDYNRETGITEKYEISPCETHCPSSLKTLSIPFSLFCHLFLLIKEHFIYFLLIGKEILWYYLFIGKIVCWLYTGILVIFCFRIRISVFSEKINK